ncbi:MAG: formylglycine-generating enzyme family protein [Microcystis sp. LE18-22.4A]|uniref:formylglycine-generating enzyme family protein n=1 Tax=Microcystis sp. LE18-22.4A TaxID=3016432 RepID=UPI0022CA3C62|nr:formylglycine-generating enzyme family protein [Microcystis sp. LE18-22.4A]MCZ8117221.1 formylglycine-generating enzyme family protein [Microcystis sp. LE18-22.4A]
MLEQFVAFVDTEKWELDSIQIAEVLWFVRTVNPLIRGEADGAYQFCLLAFLKGVENLGLCLVWGTILEKWETPQIEFTKYQQELMMITLFWTLIEKGLYSIALLLFLEKKGVGKKLTKPPLSELKYPLTSPSNKPVSSTAIEPNPYPTEQLPIKLPDTGIFRNTLELGRLLKPLKQKINSRIAQELNIKETVKRSAELSTPTQPRYFPVLTPKKERWLDVALLIEDSKSMILWQSLLKEVQDFLEHLGAFRDIKPYRMNWDDLTKTLQISSFYSFSQYLSPQTLNAPGSRRLILIVSDCISPAWISEQFIDILQQWSSQSLLTVLNPFPERIWERTNLDYAIKIRLGNKKKGLTPQSWQAIPLESWQIKGFDKQALLKLVKLPIVSLESESIKAWVNVIMGKGISWCSGVWLGSNFMYSYEEEEEDDEKSLTTLQQINNFYATSSQLAWELIQWLSAIPVSFSTIRLVQRTLLPESTQVHVAEVVMGGLLSPITPLNYYQSNYPIQFEFKPGIRETFLDKIAADKQINKKEFCLRVIGSLTEKIASHFGYQTIREFEATLLTNPLELSGEDDLELIQAFATISVSTLRQYGEEYAPYIRKLDKSRARLNLVSAVEGNSIGFNWIDFLESIAQRHHLTDIETETLINFLPTPSQSYSIPEVAKQLLLSPSAISSRLTGIYCKFETLNPNLFQSKKYNKLSTLKLYLYSQYVKVSFLHQLAIPDYAIPQLETLELFEFESEVATITFEPVITDLLSQNLRNFSFETPTVNRRGEIIKTTTHTANCFTETLPNNVDLDMVSIPGGTFTMGSPKNEKDSHYNERPQHNVKVPPFFMGKYSITQGQWKVIATRTDLKVKIDLKEDPSYFKKPYQDQDREIDRWLRPVERVNWYEAVEFCQRLSKLTGRDYRLPSEAQWEYACRAMTEPLDLAKGESYPPFYVGETLTDKLANYNASRTYASEPKGENGKETIPVGQFPPNAFGLYDLHGNVWEWCMDDWHDNYENAPSDGSAWLDNNQEENIDAENSLESTEKDENNPYSVMRGGSWGNYPLICRSAIRISYYRRDYRYYYIGFRVVCVFGRTL